MSTFGRRAPRRTTRGPGIRSGTGGDRDSAQVRSGDPEDAVGDDPADGGVEEDGEAVVARSGDRRRGPCRRSRSGRSRKVSPFSQVETRTTVSGSGTANGSANMSVLGIVNGGDSPGDRVIGRLDPDVLGPAVLSPVARLARHPHQSA